MLSLFFLTIGTSILTTLQSVILHRLEVSSLIVGIITAAYYLGFVYAAFSVEKFILRVAHIRAYATFAALLSALMLLQGIFTIPEVWIGIRLLGGVCAAGLLVVIESWMLSKSSAQTRGQVLALYMVVYYGAQTLAQFFLKLGYDPELLLFAVAAMICSVSIVPLATTKTHLPDIAEPSVLSFRALYRKSPSGVFGCIVAGLLIGPIYGLLPIYIAFYMKTDYVATAMAVCILGGMLGQYPFGRLSDIIDRRLAIALAFSIVFLTTVVLIFFQLPVYLWFGALFLFGGATFVIYPLSMSHACDVLNTKEMIAATQGLVLGNSLGMVLGPLLAAVMINYFNARMGYLSFFAIISFAMTFFFLWRVIAGYKVKRAQDFIGMPRITPVGVEFDPRVEENKED
jgi:MFS family permease